MPREGPLSALCAGHSGPHQRVPAPRADQALRPGLVMSL